MSSHASPAPGPDPAHDVELVGRARAGDAEAVERLLDRLACVPAMLRERHRRLGSPLSAEDLAEVEQETYTALWSKLAGFEGRAALETWAYRFVVLELLKGLDRRARRASSGDDERLALVALHAALERVGPPGADVIRMRHFDQLSFDAIAARSGEPEPTVKARYYRAMKRLREALEPHLRRVRR
jgi:RNA polymerase sigma-70 factor, ECF subfamily